MDEVGSSKLSEITKGSLFPASRFQGVVCPLVFFCCLPLPPANLYSWLPSRCIFLDIFLFVTSTSEVYQSSFSIYTISPYTMYKYINIHFLLCVWHWPNIKSQGHSIKMSLQEWHNKSTQRNYSLVNYPLFLVVVRTVENGLLLQ